MRFVHLNSYRMRENAPKCSKNHYETITPGRRRMESEGGSASPAAVVDQQNK